MLSIYKYCIKKIIAICFIILITPAFSQNYKLVDSLKKIIHKSKSDSVVVLSYIKLANEYNNKLFLKKYYYQKALEFTVKTGYKKGTADIYETMANDPINANNYTLALDYLRKAVTIYTELDLKYNVMQCYNAISVQYFYKGDNYKALEFSSKALQIAKDNNYENNKAIIYSNINLVYIRLGDYEKANEYSFNALRIFQKNNNKQQIARCKLNIGSLFYKLSDYKKSFKYFSEAMNDFKEINDTKGYSICLTNLGSIYNIQKNYKQALKYFLKAVEIDKKNNDLDGISSNYSNIGSAYYQLNSYATAMKYFRKSEEIYKKSSDINGLASVYFNISRIETKRKYFNIAQNYCQKSIELFTESGDLDQKRIALEQLANIYHLTGNNDKAYKVYLESAGLKDSLFNIEKTKKIAIFEEKYLNEKLEKENLTLKFKNDIQSTKIDSQRRLNITYLVTLLLSIAAIIIIVIQLRKKNIAYKYIVKKNIDLMSKEHEIKEMRNQIRNVLDTEEQKNTISEDEKEKVLRRLEKLLEVDKIYKKTDLSIEKLAKRLLTNRTYLSQIINEEFDKKYTDFINEYRVKEAMLMLSDIQFTKKYSIEAIANEAGFNTISNFNSVFKKYTGITPSVFKKETDNQTSKS